MRLFFPLLTTLILGLAAVASGSAPVVPDPRYFPVVEALDPAVAFWTRIYSRWDSNHVLIHDDRHLGIIYSVLDFTELESSGISEVRKKQARRAEVEQAKKRIERILSDLAHGRTSEASSAEQRRIELLFRTVPGGREKYTAARRRLRAQTCLEDRFEEAVERAGLYLPHMEKVFAGLGLPQELTRMPFVESMFQSRAHSKVAAAGLWQFMPGTGKLYLRMDLELDERYDPLRATIGAAKLLADNFEDLKTWPLAITAYNHGRYGMKRAVRRHGTTDLGVLIEKYRSRSFGFASRNFYAEFVAAARVFDDRETHFPSTHPLPPLSFEEATPEEFVHLPSWAASAETSLDQLRELNPGLEDSVWTGDLLFPRGYPLRVPATTLARFERAWDDLPAGRTSPRQTVRFYTVRSGDSLGSIARSLGTSLKRLQTANRITNPNRIRIGQRLMVPPDASSAGEVRLATLPENHSVRRGESLSSIARQYGVDVTELQELNGLERPDLLEIGQSLRLPGTSSSGTKHVVRPGESLAAIAARYGTTVAALKVANALGGSVIHPRQVLSIP